MNSNQDKPQTFTEDLLFAKRFTHTFTESKQFLGKKAAILLSDKDTTFQRGQVACPYLLSWGRWGPVLPT